MTTMHWKQRVHQVKANGIFRQVEDGTDKQVASFESLPSQVCTCYSGAHLFMESNDSLAWKGAISVEKIGSEADRQELTKKSPNSSPSQ